jgi:hypothetical protein
MMMMMKMMMMVSVSKIVECGLQNLLSICVRKETRSEKGLKGHALTWKLKYLFYLQEE